MEVGGQQGETTLTTRSEPYNGKAIHAESEIESANIRKLVGNRRGISQDVLPAVARSILWDSARPSARNWRAAKFPLK